MPSSGNPIWTRGTQVVLDAAAAVVGERQHDAHLDRWVERRAAVPEVRVRGGPGALGEGELAGNVVVLDGQCAVVAGIGVVHAGGEQVAHEADAGAELLRFPGVDELTAGLHAPRVWNAEHARVPGRALEHTEVLHDARQRHVEGSGELGVPSTSRMTPETDRGTAGPDAHRGPRRFGLSPGVHVNAVGAPRADWRALDDAMWRQKTR